MSNETLYYLPGIRVQCLTNHTKTVEERIYVCTNLGKFENTAEDKGKCYGAACAYSDILNKSFQHTLDIGNFISVENFLGKDG